MNYSENYGFALPEGDDFYDIAPISENFDAVDGILAENDSALQDISEKIGTPAESGQTLFSLMGGGGSVIKSIQHVTYKPPRNTASGSISIQTVDPTKAFVIFERLHDEAHEYLSKFAYTLNANSISCTFEQNASDVLRHYGFWIIEFC